MLSNISYNAVITNDPAQFQQECHKEIIGSTIGAHHVEHCTYQYGLAIHLNGRPSAWHLTKRCSRRLHLAHYPGGSTN